MNILYIIILYIIGAYLLNRRYKTVGIIQVRDVIMFAFSPLYVIPVILMPILSIFVDLDRIITK